jgi:hypothetical protein
VLPDGKVIVEGGEYNGGVQNDGTLGAFYDPVANTWKSVSPPAGWTNVGDAPSVVTPNGSFMMGACCSAQEAVLDESSLTWTAVGTGQADSNSEEGWTLLPSGNVLTVDSQNGTQSELYNPNTQTWSLAGSTGQSLVGSVSIEFGPSILMPDGRVFQVGGNANTAIYGTDGNWTAGPLLPNVPGGQLNGGDSPAALLPNGHVLIAPGVGLWNAQVHFFEFDGTNLNPVTSTPNAATDQAYNQRFLLLPTGQVLLTDATSNVQIYTPAGGPSSAWAPTISSVPTTIRRGTFNTVVGTQFNGLSQAVAYGDDAQMATNYPLVRVTNNATHHVFYARTENGPDSGVAGGTKVMLATFDLPTSAETGSSQLVVVANGIASAPVSVTVQ